MHVASGTTRDRGDGADTPPWRLPPGSLTVVETAISPGQAACATRGLLCGIVRFRKPTVRWITANAGLADRCGIRMEPGSPITTVIVERAARGKANGPCVVG